MNTRQKGETARYGGELADDVAATEVVVEGKQVAGRGRRRGLDEEEVDSWPPRKSRHLRITPVCPD